MRRPSRLALVGVSALTLAVVGVAPASASVGASVSLSIVGSYCTGTYSWAGANASTRFASPSWARGTVKHCAYKYRMADSDKYYDYYLAYLQSDMVYKGGSRSLPAASYQGVVSSRSASSNVYAATNSYTSSKSCTTPVTLRVGAGPLSASVTPQICSGYSVNRSSFGPSSARWVAPKTGGVELMEGVFFQKVPQGTKPVFDYEFVRPTYAHTWDGNFWVEKAGFTTRTVRL